MFLRQEPRQHIMGSGSLSEQRVTAAGVVFLPTCSCDDSQILNVGYWVIRSVSLSFFYSQKESDRRKRDAISVVLVFYRQVLLPVGHMFVARVALI